MKEAHKRMYMLGVMPTKDAVYGNTAPAIAKRASREYRSDGHLKLTNRIRGAKKILESLVVNGEVAKEQISLPILAGDLGRKKNITVYRRI